MAHTVLPVSCCSKWMAADYEFRPYEILKYCLRDSIYLANPDLRVHIFIDPYEGYVVPYTDKEARMATTILSMMKQMYKTLPKERSVRVNDVTGVKDVWPRLRNHLKKLDPERPRPKVQKILVGRLAMPYQSYVLESLIFAGKFLAGCMDRFKHEVDEIFDIAVEKLEDFYAEENVLYWIQRASLVMDPFGKPVKHAKSEMADQTVCGPSFEDEEDSFKLLIGSLEPGLYVSRRKGLDHGFFVSLNEGKITFELFRIRYPMHHNSECKHMLQEIRKDLSSITHFLNEFFREYMFYDNDTINVYNTQGYGYIFVNHVNQTLLFAYQDLYHLKEGKCTVEFAHGLINKVSVQKDRFIDIEQWNEDDECEMKLKLNPISLDTVLLNGNTLVDKMTAFKLEFLISDDVLINKKTCSCFIRYDFYNTIPVDHSPETFNMIQINP